jgi:hypothetical protein
MGDKLYLLRMNTPNVKMQLIAAASAEIHRGHLVFLNSERRMLFALSLESIESWQEL